MWEFHANGDALECTMFYKHIFGFDINKISNFHVKIIIITTTKRIKMKNQHIANPKLFLLLHFHILLCSNCVSTTVPKGK